LTFTHEQFVSPFSWRYGSEQMRTLWGERHKRLLWRRIWVALAQAQQRAGLVSAEQVADLQAHQTQIDIARALAIEASVQHDVMAEVRTYAEQARIGGGIIHMGATSADIQDNADVLRMRDSLDLIISGLEAVLTTLATQIDALAEHVVMAFTHIQPAEPTTMGYRLALYAQDLLDDLADARAVRDGLRGKGFKGAVGTAASYGELLHGTTMTPADMETLVMSALDLPPFVAASQTYPRKQDWRVVTVLSGVASSLYKFAFDLRLLQSPVIGEWGEPFGKDQIGSSAMPFKRNPINAEKINSLARLVVAMQNVAWDNSSHSLLERTLDDSANRREMLPVAFLATDELIRTAQRIIAGLRVDAVAAARNLARFGVFAATERVLMAAGRKGADRQHLHHVLREHSLAAWAALAADQPNPLVESLAASADLAPYLTPDEIRALLDASAYVGDAPARARAIVSAIRAAVSAG
jgi:adenylosuccinate lyase